MEIGERELQENGNTYCFQGLNWVVRSSETADSILVTRLSVTIQRLMLAWNLKMEVRMRFFGKMKACVIIMC